MQHNNYEPAYASIMLSTRMYVYNLSTNIMHNCTPYMHAQLVLVLIDNITRLYVIYKQTDLLSHEYIPAELLINDRDQSPLQGFHHVVCGRVIYRMH